MISKGETRTKSEGYQLAMTYKALEDQEETVQRLLEMFYILKKRRDWASMKHHLSGRHPLIYAQFSRVDTDGFTTVGKEPFDVWTAAKSQTSSDYPQSKKSSSDSLEQVLAKAMRKVYSVSLGDRQRFLEFWVEEICDDITSDLFESVKEANQLHQQLTNVHDDVERRVLETADVIGVTITGLARRIATLQHIRYKVAKNRAKRWSPI